MNSKSERRLTVVLSPDSIESLKGLKTIGERVRFVRKTVLKIKSGTLSQRIKKPDGKSRLSGLREQH